MTEARTAEEIARAIYDKWMTSHSEDRQMRGLIAAAITTARKTALEDAANLAAEWRFSILGDGAVEHREAESMVRSTLDGLGEAILALSTGETA